MKAPFAQFSPVRPAPRRRWYMLVAALGFGLWWLGSILVHALLFGVLYVASPKPSVSPDAAADDFQMTVSPEHVASVVADIREQQKEEFTKKIEELASVKAQLDALDAAKIEQYNALMREEAKGAPQAIRQAEADVRARQEKALQAQATAQTAIGKMNEAQTRAAATRDDAGRAAAEQELKNATQALRDAQAAASQAQQQASASQAKLAQQINLFDDAMAPARRASEDATKAQAEAQRQQDASATTRLQWETEQRRIEQQTAEVQRFHTATDAATQRVTDLEKRLTALQPPPPPPAAAPFPTPAANGNVAGTPGTPASTVSPTPNPAPTATPVPSPSKQAKQEIDRLNVALKQNRDAQSKMAAREADARQKLAATQESVTRQQQKLQTEQEQARQKQQTALEVQTKAGQTILAAADKPGLVPASATASATAPSTAPPDANLADLFRQAQQMEAAVAESYRNVRAAELAALRKISLAQAAAMTEVAKPVRAEIDTGILTRDIRDVQGVRTQEKTLAMASEQMNSMVALAQRMRELAQPAQTTVSVADMKAASAHTEHMERLAMEDEGTTAKDLTAAMQGADRPGGRRSGSDNGEALAQATSSLAIAAVRLTTNPTDPGALQAYQSALATMQALISKNGANGAGDDRTSDEPLRAGTAPGVPALDPKHFKPIPGRTITASMVAGPADRQREWMFVDSWFIIGPWPNPGRKNLDTKFPPESVVDLDATYPGGRRNEVPLPVRWRFHQASAVSKNSWGDQTGMIVPPGLEEFEIYYAYTELWLDEAADLWVAIGSDDQSKVWLNDQMIWKSADYYKSWVANEGLRKVHFNKGINRVLYRLENGQNSGGYSLMVCLDPKAPPPPEARPAGKR